MDVREPQRQGSGREREQEEAPEGRPRTADADWTDWRCPLLHCALRYDASGGFAPRLGSLGYAQRIVTAVQDGASQTTATLPYHAVCSYGAADPTLRGNGPPGL